VEKAERTEAVNDRFDIKLPTRTAAVAGRRVTLSGPNYKDKAPCITTL